MPSATPKGRPLTEQEDNMHRLEVAVDAVSSALHTWAKARGVQTSGPTRNVYGLLNLVSRLWKDLDPDSYPDKGHEYTRTMFVCDSCSFAHCHRLVYCPKCPGRMRYRSIRSRNDYTWESFVEACKEQGLNYEGDYNFDLEPPGY